MDIYVKQLLSEMGQQTKILSEKFLKAEKFIKKIFSDAFGHISDYEKYYQTIKNSDDKKVVPGTLPFSVYTRSEPDEKSKEDDPEDSEKLSAVLKESKKILDRNLKTFKSETIIIEQAVNEYIQLIREIQDYYEDLIEELKF